MLQQIDKFPSGEDDAPRVIQRKIDGNETGHDQKEDEREAIIRWYTNAAKNLPFSIAAK